MRVIIIWSKLNTSPLILELDLSLAPRIKYPPIASKTCCQGLVDKGFLNITLLFDQDFTQSGTSLS